MGSCIKTSKLIATNPKAISPSSLSKADLFQIKGLRMAPTNATVPIEKKVELKEETNESMGDGCTQSTDKLLEGNIGEIAKEHLGTCKCCGKECCSKQCCGKCECCEQKESNNADQDCPNKCSKDCCSNKCCAQCACCANTESAKTEQ